MAYRIFADVTADIPDPAADGISEIQMIPMQVEICGRNYTYGPGGNLSISDFYKMQREGNYASTSQINPSVYTAYFEPVLLEGISSGHFPIWRFIPSGVLATEKSWPTVIC